MLTKNMPDNVLSALENDPDYQDMINNPGNFHTEVGEEEAVYECSLGAETAELVRRLNILGYTYTVSPDPVMQTTFVTYTGEALLHISEIFGRSDVGLSARAGEVESEKQQRLDQIAEEKRNASQKAAAREWYALPLRSRIFRIISGMLSLEHST